MKEPTANQKIFIDEYCKDRNGARAYLAAYPRVKKDSVARACAARLLTKANIKKIIDKKLKTLEEKAGIDAQRVLEEESHIAFSDLGQLFKKGVLLSPDELPEGVRKAIASVKVKVRKIRLPDGKFETETTYQYRFWDKGQSLQRLQKHLGMYAPETVSGGITVVLENLGQRLDEAHKRLADPDKDHQFEQKPAIDKPQKPKAKVKREVGVL